MNVLFLSGSDLLSIPLDAPPRVGDYVEVSDGGDLVIEGVVATVLWRISKERRERPNNIVEYVGTARVSVFVDKVKP